MVSSSKTKLVVVVALPDAVQAATVGVIASSTERAIQIGTGTHRYVPR